eukprot:PhM_4_TR8378/c9_g1_i1/m.65954
MTLSRCPSLTWSAISCIVRIVRPSALRMPGGCGPGVSPDLGGRPVSKTGSTKGIGTVRASNTCAESRGTAGSAGTSVIQSESSSIVLPIVMASSSITDVGNSTMHTSPVWVQLLRVPRTNDHDGCTWAPDVTVTCLPGLRCRGCVCVFDADRSPRCCFCARDTRSHMSVNATFCCCDGAIAWPARVSVCTSYRTFVSPTLAAALCCRGAEDDRGGRALDGGTVNIFGVVLSGRGEMRPSGVGAQGSVCTSWHSNVTAPLGVYTVYSSRETRKWCARAVPEPPGPSLGGRDPCCTGVVLPLFDCFSDADPPNTGDGTPLTLPLTFWTLQDEALPPPPPRLSLEELKFDIGDTPAEAVIIFSALIGGTTVRGSNWAVHMTSLVVSCTPTEDPTTSFFLSLLPSLLSSSS